MDAASPLILFPRQNPPQSQLPPLYVYTPPGPPPTSNDLGLVLPSCMSPSSHPSSAAGQWDFFPAGPPRPPPPGMAGPPRPPPPQLWNPSQRPGLPPGLPPNAPFFRCPAPPRPPQLPGLKFFDHHPHHHHRPPPPPPLHGGPFRAPPFHPPPPPPFMPPDFFSTPPPATLATSLPPIGVNQMGAFRPAAFFDGRLPEEPDPEDKDDPHLQQQLYDSNQVPITTSGSTSQTTIAADPATESMTVSSANNHQIIDPLVSRPPPPGFKGPSPPRASYSTQTTTNTTPCLLQPMVTSTPTELTTYPPLPPRSSPSLIPPPPGFSRFPMTLNSEPFGINQSLSLAMESLNLGSSNATTPGGAMGMAGVIGGERISNLSGEELDRCSPVRPTSAVDQHFQEYSALSPDSGIAEAHGFEEDVLALNFMGEDIVTERRPLLSGKERVEIEGEFDRIYAVYSESLQSIKDVHTEFLDLEQRLAQARQEEHRDEDAVKMIQEELKLRHRVLFDCAEYRKNTQRIREMEKELTEIKRVVMNWDHAVADRILVGNLMEENRRQSRLIASDSSNPVVRSLTAEFRVSPQKSPPLASSQSSSIPFSSDIGLMINPFVQNHQESTLWAPLTEKKEPTVYPSSPHPLLPPRIMDHHHFPMKMMEETTRGPTRPRFTVPFRSGKSERDPFGATMIRGGSSNAGSFAAAVMTNHKSAPSATGMLRLGCHTIGGQETYKSNAKPNSSRDKKNATAGKGQSSTAPNTSPQKGQQQQSQKTTVGGNKSTPARTFTANRRRSRAKKALQLSEAPATKE